MDSHIFIPDPSDNRRKIYTGKPIKGEKHKPWRYRSMGWDPGKRQDSAGVAIVDLCDDDVFRVIAITAWFNMDYTKQYRHLNKLAAMFDLDYFVFDANGPGGSCEDSLREINPDNTYRYPNLSRRDKKIMYPIYGHTKEFKYRIYGGIKILMSQGRFKMLIDTNLEDQFAALSINDRGSISHKKDTSIDIPSAILMAMAPFIDPKHKQVTNDFDYIIMDL